MYADPFIFLNISTATNFSLFTDSILGLVSERTEKFHSKDNEKALSYRDALLGDQ